MFDNMSEFYKCLIKRVDGPDKQANSVSLEDVGKLKLTDDLCQDILNCLNSDKDVDVKFGIFFCEGLAKAEQLNSLSKQWMQQFAQAFERLLKHNSGQVRGGATALITQFQSYYLDYRGLMLRCLQDSSSSVRSAALNAYRSYLHPKEIQPLLPFQEDSYAMETSMNGPLVYALRNRAIEIIEELLQKKFPKCELTAALDGDTVFWWDWKPFLDWWNHQQV